MLVVTVPMEEDDTDYSDMPPLIDDDMPPLIEDDMPPLIEDDMPPLIDDDMPPLIDDDDDVDTNRIPNRYTYVIYNIE